MGTSSDVQVRTASSVAQAGGSSVAAGATSRTAATLNPASSSVAVPRIPWSVLDAFLAGSSADEDLFSDYATKVWSETCWARHWDFSGVSWEYTGVSSERRCALIGRNCWTSAYHLAPRIGGRVQFTDKFGQRFSYTVDAVAGAGATGDLEVGTFSSTVSTSLTSYKVDEDVEALDYLVATRSRASAAARTPTTQRAMIERVKVLGGVDINFTTAQVAPAEVLARWGAADDGDSSDPLFVLRGGTLELVGHYAGGVIAPYLGANLVEIDAWLALNGGVRLAQAGA